VNTNDLLDLDVLQELQDSFATVTGMSVLLCRRDGEILTRPSFGNELCRLMYERWPDGAERCPASALAVSRATDSGEPGQPTACREGIYQYAAPIVVAGRRLATIVVGTDPCAWLKNVPKQQISRITGLSVDEITETLNRPVKLSDRQLQAAIDLLHSLATALARSSHREHQLNQRVNELTMLHSVASMFAGRADLDEILRITAEQVVQLTAAKACSIRTFDSDRRELQIRAVANLSEEYLHKGPVKLEESEIDQAALRDHPVHISDMANDPRVLYKAEARREGLASGLAVGMIYRGQPVGVIHVYTAEEYQFSKFEVEALKAIASQAASAVINAQLHLEAHEAEQMQRQLQLAGEIQRRMLPSATPDVPNIDIGTVYEPSYQVGGDLYDFVELHDGRLAVVIADVAGKGVPASLQMASLRSALRANGATAGNVAEIITRTHHAFMRDSLTGEFATLFMGAIDPESGTLEYLDAGHNPPVLVRHRSQTELDVTGPPVGIFDHPKYEARSLKLEPGDTIVMYTDGLIEAMDFDSQQFGMTRLLAAIERYVDHSAQAMAENILWDVRRFAGLATQSDDISLVIVKYRSRC